MEKESYFAPAEPERRSAKALIVIIYDISEQKQRNRMVKYLEGFGHRVQKSAFEAWLNERQFLKLCAGVDRIVYPEDHVKIYRVRGNGDTYTWGGSETVEPEDVVII